MCAWFVSFLLNALVSREGPAVKAERPLFSGEATFADASRSNGLAPKPVVVRPRSNRGLPTKPKPPKPVYSHPQSLPGLIGLRRSYSPDSAVMRRDGQRHLLQRGHVLEIEGPAVQFLDVVAGDREPERYSLFNAAGVNSDKRVASALVAGEHEHAVPLVAIPIVKEVVRPTPDVGALTPDAQQL